MYRVDETGVINNYADMPKTYFAHFPTFYEQRAYLRQAGAALLLVATLIAIACGVS